MQISSCVMFRVYLILKLIFYLVCRSPVSGHYIRPPTPIPPLFHHSSPKSSSVRSWLPLTCPRAFFFRHLSLWLVVLHPFLSSPLSFTSSAQRTHTTLLFCLARGSLSRSRHTQSLPLRHLLLFASPRLSYLHRLYGSTAFHASRHPTLPRGKPGPPATSPAHFVTPSRPARIFTSRLRA